MRSDNRRVVTDRGWTKRRFIKGAVGLVAGLAVAPSTFVPSAFAVEALGSNSGLPVPRYVSLKSDRVNLREGPAKDHRTVWIFQRAGLPVEIMAEFETWRKVRDSEGAEGWVLHSLLSGRRTALVTPWKKGKENVVSTLFNKPAEGAAMTAMLQPGVLATIKTCDKVWCRITGDGFDGYIHQTELWGVYPNEVIE